VNVPTVEPSRWTNTNVDASRLVRTNASDDGDITNISGIACSDTYCTGRCSRSQRFDTDLTASYGGTKATTNGGRSTSAWFNRPALCKEVTTNSICVCMTTPDGDSSTVVDTVQWVATVDINYCTSASKASTRTDKHITTDWAGSTVQ
jgi:hypothetical protein